MATTSVKEKDFMTVVRERRSVRHYDPAAKISREELSDMLKEAALAPSSSNLQPWRFLVFDDPAVKERLLPIANNQKQVVDAAAVIAVLGDVQGYENAPKVYKAAVEAGYMTKEIAQNMIERTLTGYPQIGREKLEHIALIDGGLVSMQLMLAAKARGYDTVPMGGFHADRLMQEFEIPERYVPVMLIAVGKAASPGHPTTRLPIEDITFWNGFAK
ncbi:nitroreductase family protein [Paenibacillus sp. MSJ-34]|uniref:nitroreductase family protein n=1 Tax=Paenibacillus sp. MSJ-34 TaxID=2841529 RepID=UPI001C124F2B|nr:nitroreductase family protein [Paenibacillus sp. MSJ-34]MBU5441152.1 nitroreductase family protein [Paenibacillus sp. MSJ-34]